MEVNMRNHSYHMAVVFLIGLLISISFPSSLLAEQIQLAWDPNTEPDIAGYKVHYGTLSRLQSPDGRYQVSSDVIDTTTYPLDLQAGVTYYIAVTAVDDSGNESDFSVELKRSGYTDVPANGWYDFVMAISDGGITGGCVGDNPSTEENEAYFCPDDPISRGQMAVFIETSLNNAPNACTGQFDDVATDNPFCGFIERLAADGITGGCGGNNFCPNDPISRGQMAVFIEVALGNISNPCTGLFADVLTNDPFCGFIEKMAADGITSGCGGNNFCPGDPVTRAQMAVFLVLAPDPLYP
jgi:hypothetical protein